MNIKPLTPSERGKLGGRPKGSKGKPITSDRARELASARWAKYRAMKGVKAWNRCDVCGQFIPISDFDNGASRKMITPDSDRSSEDYETLCKIHSKPTTTEGVNK